MNYPILGVNDQINTPAPSGMFGGGDQSWRNALLALAAGLMARRSPGVSGNIINGLQEAQTLKQRIAEAQQQHQQEFQDARLAHQQDRQFDIANPAPQQPGEFETALQASGVQPGTAEWVQAMKARAQNFTDPVVMTPQGPMLRSQVLSGAQAGTPAPQGVTFSPLPVQGGQTPQASGGFPY